MANDLSSALRRVGSSTLAIAAVAAGCGGGGPNLESLRDRPGPPLYYVGESFSGLPLTDVLDDPNMVTFIYGDCDVPPGSDGGCPPPLQLQNVTCTGNTGVAIFANGGGLAVRASRALRPLNVTRAPRPAVSFDSNRFLGACNAP